MWIPLMDYAMKTGISLSTLRRYIKAKKIQYRIENGRYLLFDGEAMPGQMPAVLFSSDDDGQVTQLQGKLKKAQEEIAELKTLIAFYEESLAKGFSPGLNPAPAVEPARNLNRFNG